MKLFKKFTRDTKAATAIEYGLIAALIELPASPPWAQWATASRTRSTT